MFIREILAVAGVIAFLIAAVTILIKQPQATSNSWLAPALLAAVFLAFSLVSVASEGPFGFWYDHVEDFWGNQIWFDLLLAIGAAWYVLVPRMRRLDMRPLPWLAFIACTGSVGLLATLARTVYLEGRSPHYARKRTDAALTTR